MKKAVGKSLGKVQKCTGLFNLKDASIINVWTTVAYFFNTRNKFS